ncbi:hypothetical protein ABFX02_08G154700 [Erythranthe guttata]
MAERVHQQLKELGSKLESPPASEKALVKLLKQSASLLSELDQSPLESVVKSTEPFLNAIVKPELLKIQEPEVKLYLASCICEITRITAPEAPYDDHILKDVFQLIVSTFSGLSDIKDPSFGRRVVILDTLATYRSCVVMLDLDCDDLINEMFNTFFVVARDEHPQNVLTSMQTIMEVLLEESEDVPESLLLILLSIFSRDKDDVTTAARKIAVNVIENSAAKLETGLKQLLVMSMSGDSESLNSGINWHAVLYDVYRSAPQILSGVVPYLTGELLSGQLDIRLKAVSLVGRLFALPGSVISEAFKPVFLEFLKRLTDKAVEVRMSVLEYIKSCLLENPLRAEAHQIISALCDQLLDSDENVRKQVVSVVSDVACDSLTSIPVETIKLISERLRDKSLLVKRYTMERLADIYRISCMKQSSGSTKDDGYDWIVGKILRCFYDKDFRSDAIEPILSLSLFPADFSTKDKVTSWVRIFSGFEKVEVKALEKILEQKQRLQKEMQKYLSLRQLPQEVDETEIQKKVTVCFRVVACCFSDPVKTEENFKSFDQLKDSNIWKILMELLDPSTNSLKASSLRDDLLKILGQKHQLYEFLSTLSVKCSFLLFDKDHVREILLEASEQKSTGTTELVLSCMTVLVILASFCPLLLGGIEDDLLHLLEDDNEIIKEGILHILAKAGGTIREQLGVSSRSLDLILERICIEGSRRQAKYAVHALASITKDDGLMSLSVLYKRLVDMLEEKSHLPAVLQSLGCIAQAAMPIFETREDEIEKFIKKNILEFEHITGDKTTAGWDDRSELCSLKIFGVKALVKSYLPVKDAHLRHGIDGIIEILKKILLFGDIARGIESSLVDRAHLKLAAAKAVIRLSKQWEHKIPLDVLYLTLRTSEDKFPEVKKLLLNKVHQYVRDRILAPKYACAFLLDISASQSDSEESKRYLNDIIQMCRQGRSRQISPQSDANSPHLYAENILPYVVHSLAHHPSFPNIDECKDVKKFEPMYRQLHLFLSMLVYEEADGKNDVNISKDKERISMLNSIFRHIKRSEDAFDVAKSKNLYALCDLGLPIIKRLAPNKDEIHDSSSSVTLPPVFYKPLEKKDENDSLVGEEKTWLADEGVLAHFESLELEANKIAHSIISEDDLIKDSETEGSEMPLGKLMKLLKAKAAKAKKEDKNGPAQGSAENGSDFDILKMVKEINSDNMDTTSKFESSNGHQYARKKRSDNEPQKRKSFFSEASDIPVPKRRRSSSGQARKPVLTVDLKDSKKPANVVNQENSNIKSDKMDKEPKSDKMDKEPKSDSEDEDVQEKTEFKFLSSSRIRKKSGTSSKQKRKRPNRDHGEAVNNSPEAKKPKKVPNTDSTCSVSYSKSGSMKKQTPKSVAALAKCTTKDKGSSKDNLIGCRIKVWWPMDKQYYEGVVDSYDNEKKKHKVLYDDGEVEVIRLDKERWELIDSDPKPKKSGSSKGLSTKGGSSVKGRKSSGGPKQGKKSKEKSVSQVKRKRSSVTNPKRRPKNKSKSESSEESGADDLTSEEKEESEKIEKSLSTEENVEKGSSDAEVSKQEEKDSEDTESDDFVGSPHFARGSNNEEASSSSDKQQLSETKEESADEEDTKTSASESANTELSDDEPLGVWKQRSGKKRGQ